MRFRILLTPEKESLTLPYSYNYYLASLIYYFLGGSAPDFSTHLHNRGYSEGGKSFKLFTFSPLLSPHTIAREKGITLRGKVQWLISSPREEFLTALAEGILKSGHFTLMRQKLLVEQLEVLEAPIFEGKISFQVLSPIVVSTGEKWPDGTFHKRYLSPFEPAFYELLEQNLRRKYLTCYGEEAPFTPLSFQLDEEFVARKRRVSKLLDYKGTKIRGWIAPFTAEGNPDLLRIGYEAGFGEANSAGFGMVEVEKQAPSPPPFLNSV